jgi:hypothetical protein
MMIDYLTDEKLSFLIILYLYESYLKEKYVFLLNKRKKSLAALLTYQVSVPVPKY